jgi:hypothetical protein
MKNIFTGMMTVAFAFSVAGFALAADNAAAPAAAPVASPAASPAADNAASPAASPAAEKAPAAKKAPKPKTVLATGTIEALDAAAGTFTVKGKKGSVDLKAGEKVKLGGYKVGDKVVVKYADGTASSVKAVKGAKAAPAATPAMPAEKK